MTPPLPASEGASTRVEISEGSFITRGLTGPLALFNHAAPTAETACQPTVGRCFSEVPRLPAFVPHTRAVLRRK